MFSAPTIPSEGAREWLRRPRAGDAEYLPFVAEFVEAVKAKWPKAGRPPDP